MNVYESKTWSVIHTVTMESWAERLAVWGDTVYIGVRRCGVMAWQFCSKAPPTLVAAHDDYITAVFVFDAELSALITFWHCRAFHFKSVPGLSTTRVGAKTKAAIKVASASEGLSILFLKHDGLLFLFLAD